MPLQLNETIDAIDITTLAELRELVEETSAWPETSSVVLRIERGDPKDPREAAYRKDVLRVTKDHVE